MINGFTFPCWKALKPFQGYSFSQEGCRARREFIPSHIWRPGQKTPDDALMFFFVFSIDTLVAAFNPSLQMAANRNERQQTICDRRHNETGEFSDGRYAAAWDVDSPLISIQELPEKMLLLCLETSTRTQGLYLVVFGMPWLCT